jgi:2-oxoglutarate dehydrogenase E2 component (dihydrolipoamide succinyltransferase)
MAVEIKVPTIGESINEVVVSAWLKNEGESVSRDESVVELESDKATVEVPAPAGGTITKVLKKAGDSAQVGEVIAYLEEGAGAAKSAAKQEEPAAAEAAPASNGSAPATEKQSGAVMPSAQRVLAEKGIDAAGVKGSGPGGRVLKEDAVKAAAGSGTGAPARGKSNEAQTAPGRATGEGAGATEDTDYSGLEEIVPMSPIRRTIAARLVESQQTAALLTTFNEIDMGAVMALRKQYQDQFTQKHGIKLGFMSFFVKAAVDALKQFPAVNSEIRGTDIVYKNHYDIGIAIGGGKGLIVPVVRGADRLSFAEVELKIDDLGKRAQANKIDLAELQGGTFTISNGGIYGSLMSTPIVNPPQVAILGLHAIQERAVVRDGQIVIRPMMYVAVTYDHRIIDGRESVSFLRRIKDAIEDPSRMLLEV